MTKTTEYTLGNSGPLAVYGATLIDNGFAIVPIAVGKKAPNFDNWEKSRSSKPQLQEWIENGHKRAGIGILTKHTPGVDLDIRDEELALLAEKKARKIFGHGPVRIGMAPKRLMMYRTDKPFRKMRSNKYRTPDPITDGEWEFHQIEILCDGQQFVAYHIHPDTGKPYYWPEEEITKDGEIENMGGPRSMSVNDLPTITEEQCQELIDWFEDQCEYRGWEIHKKQRIMRDGEFDADDPFVEDSQRIDISYENLRDTLMMVPHADDYDQWFQIGMALYHQFHGEDDGRALWHEWSETADNYEPEKLDEKWDTFDIGGKKRAPLTARYIIKLAKEAAVERDQKIGLKLQEMFTLAKTKAEWDKAKIIMQDTDVESITRSQIVTLAKERLDSISPVKTPISEVRKALAYSGKNEKTPEWVQSWVYDTSDDKFFCTERKISVTKQGFDAMYDRKAMTKKDVLEGRAGPSASASALALNLYKIATIQGRRYMPGEDPIYSNREGKWANTYPEHEIPDTPDTLKPRDKIAINRVKNHIRHLLTDKRERRIFVDWLSWIVQNPGQHANWSILLQGTEGDGKSFFGAMMRAVMGPSNVQMLNAHILESPFTDWVVGQCLTCIEEVRLIKAHNKYELLNRIKPFITNVDIEVHPKGSKTYQAVNTTSYLLFSNFRDALPLDDDGRRYCVMFSQWQSREKLGAFKDENPDYYEELYATLETSAGALRDWLLNHEQLPTFKPKGDAPDTAARQYMIKQARPEFVNNLMELIADRVHALISDELLSVTVLTEKMEDAGMEVPMRKAMGAMLSRAKFDEIGRIRVGEDGRHYFYSRNPERFRSDSGDGGFDVDNAKVVKMYRALVRLQREMEQNDEL